MLNNIKITVTAITTIEIEIPVILSISTKFSLILLNKIIKPDTIPKAAINGSFISIKLI